MNLGIVTSYFSFNGDEQIERNWQRFVQALGDHAGRLQTEYCQIGKFSPSYVLCQKETLLNAVIRKLPAEYDAVAWLDADIAFDNQDWVKHAEYALRFNPVIQLFDRAEYLNADDSVEFTDRSRLSSVDYKLGLRGLAWAARREVLEDGLIDWHVTGLADGLMADAWTGRADKPELSPAMRETYLPWAEKQAAITQSKPAYLCHTIRHFYHGSIRHRRYGWRRQLLVKHNFDPRRDIELDGRLYRWTGNNPALEADVRTWMCGSIGRKVA